MRISLRIRQLHARSKRAGEVSKRISRMFCKSAPRKFPPESLGKGMANSDDILCENNALLRCDDDPVPLRSSSSCFFRAIDIFFFFIRSPWEFPLLSSFLVIALHRLRMRDIARIESMIRLDLTIIRKRRIHLLIFENCSSLGYENAANLPTAN